MIKAIAATILVAIFLTIVASVILYFYHSNPRTRRKILSLQKGKEIRFNVQTLTSKVVGHEKRFESDFPKGFTFVDGEIIGTPVNDGDLHIALRWNEMYKRYDTYCIFYDSSVEILLREVKKAVLLSKKREKEYTVQDTTHYHLRNDNIKIHLELVADEIANYSMIILNEKGAPLQTISKETVSRRYYKGEDSEAKILSDAPFLDIFWERFSETMSIGMKGPKSHFLIFEQQTSFPTHNEMRIDMLKNVLVSL